MPSLEDPNGECSLIGETFDYPTTSILEWGRDKVKRAAEFGSDQACAKYVQEIGVATMKCGMYWTSVAS